MAAALEIVFRCGDLREDRAGSRDVVVFAAV
jgi:hypothetical protein